VTSPTKDGRQIEQTVKDEVISRQIASVLVTGTSISDCAKQLGISVGIVRTIVSTDKYKTIVSEAAEKHLGAQFKLYKQQLGKLTPKALKAIEETLDTGSGRDKLEAAKIVLKSVGLHEEEKTQADTTLIVNLPNLGPEPKTFEVIPNEET
jgi:transposase